jgi:mono/diheme cytochrome c family protein
MKIEVRVLGAVLLGVFMALAGAASLAAASDSPIPENPVGGSSVYVAKRCLHCHAIQGSGGTKGPDLGRLQLQGGFLGMAGIMWNHAPKMISALNKNNIPFPRFTTSEMTQLVSFLYTLNYFDRPGDPRRGGEVFEAKRCFTCHKLGGAGGGIGPPLDPFGSYVSPLFVATGLWNKGPAMADAMRRAKIARPMLTGRDVQDIVAFIRARALRHPSKTSRILVRPGNPREGSALFKSKRCSSCHFKRGGEIGGGGGPLLAANHFKVSLSAITSRMWNHGPGMWALWKAKGLAPISFTVGEMADVTAYLYFLQFESPQGDRDRGSRLFRNRGCAECHEKKAGEKATAPNLRAKGPWKTDLDLVREMWNHAGKMYGKILRKSYIWPKLTEKEVADLLRYVRSIGGSEKKTGN